MIFSIDVRRRICKKHDEFLQYVTLKTDIDLLRKDEINIETSEKLKKISDELEEIINFKKECLHLEIYSFEKEFAKDVFKNPSFYEIKEE